MKNKLSGWYIAGFVLLIFLSCYLYPFALEKYLHQEHAANLGQYGDIYGGLNTLFTGLAFVGLGVTIWLQNRELRTQSAQNLKEDIYRRISLVKELEAQVKYKPVSGEKVNLDGDTQKGSKVICQFKEGAELSGAPAVCEINLAIQSLFETFLKTQWDASSRIEAESARLGVYEGLMWITPWLKTLLDLVEDITLYFQEEPEQIRRYIRVVLNSTSINTQGLLILLRNYITERPQFISLLIHKKYIDLDSSTLPFTRDCQIQEIVMNYIHLNMGVDEARSQIVALITKRNAVGTTLSNH